MYEKNGGYILITTSRETETRRAAQNDCHPMPDAYGFTRIWRAKATAHQYLAAGGFGLSLFEGPDVGTR